MFGTINLLCWEVVMQHPKSVTYQPHQKPACPPTPMAASSSMTTASSNVGQPQQPLTTIGQFLSQLYN